MTIGDFEGVVEVGRLELRQEQVQCVRKKGIGRGTGFSIAGPFGRGDFGSLSVEAEGKSKLEFNTESEVLGIGEADRIRELCRALCEIPETARAELESKKEVAKEWEALGGIQDVDSADQNRPIK